jgi:DNA-binding response OmpR family regulator
MTRVLLVEDYPDNVEVLTQFLELEGYQVDSVGTKKDAFKSLQAARYDIVVLDLLLPDAKGLEAFDAIHKSAPSTPIVILSALSDPLIASIAVKRGAQDYLIKPVDPSQLLERMEFAMARN